MKKLLLILAALFWAMPLQAQTTYYVDPSFSGGSNDGSAAHPWMDIVSHFSTINTARSSGAVTVFVSARQVGSDIPETINVSLTLDTAYSGSNRLTIDGWSMWNQNDTLGSWAPYQTLSVNPAYCVLNCSQATITAGIALDTDNCCGANPTVRHNITIHGFKFVEDNNGSHIALLNANNGLIIEYNEFTANPTQTVGPGLIFGKGGEDCGSVSTCYSNNITVQYNYVHDTFGEGIYVAGVTADPNWGGLGYTSGTNIGTAGGTGMGLTFNVTEDTGSFLGEIASLIINNPGSGYSVNDIVSVNGSGLTHVSYPQVLTINGSGGVTSIGLPPANNGVTIQYNVIQNAGQRGGQGDGTDVKEGQQNLKLIDNEYRHVAWTGSEGQAIVVESADLISGNFIHDWVNQSGSVAGTGIVLSSTWPSTIKGNLQVINNIIANVQTGGISVAAGSTKYLPYTYPLLASGVFNNSIYNVVAGDGINCADSSLTAAPQMVSMENNIVYNAASSFEFQSSVGPGSTGCNFGTHSNNLWYRTGGATIKNGITFYNSSTTPPMETGDVWTNPTFISTSSPYVPTNFELGGGSPAISAAVNLSSSFTVDFCNNTRQTSPTLWDMGAWLDNPPITTGCVLSIVNTLSFTTQPTATTSGNTMATFVVTSTDNTFSGNVTVAITGCAATLGGTRTVAAVSGVATFSAITVTGAATGCAVTASATGYSPVTSNSFNVSASASLFFTFQPPNTVSGQKIIAVAVTSSDRTFTGNVTIALASACGTALSGTLTQAATAGTVVFYNITVTGVASPCTLSASASGYASINSTQFSVTAPPTGGSTSIVLGKHH